MYVKIADMLTKEQKTKAIDSVKKSDSDTGSSAVQVAILSEKINSLAEHLKTNRKDKHSTRGLLQMVADRRKHMKYLKRTDLEKHAQVAKTLGLKG